MASDSLSVCEAFDRRDPGWRDALQARLEAIGDVRRARAAPQTEPKAPRVRDILLAGPNDDDEAERSALGRRLDREFSEERLEFRVQSIWVPEGEPRAFIGYGVFVPDPDDLRVAELEFAWTANPEPADVMVPRLGGRETDPPAAWYAGQRGVAIGFDPRWAVAKLSRRKAPPDSPAVAALADVVLFFGRRQAHARPTVEAEARGGALAPHAVSRHLQHEEWWSRNGEWQWLELAVEGKGSARLWFRILSRTGRTNFRPAAKSARHAEPPPAPDGRVRPLLILRGVIAPNPPSALRLLTGFLSGRPSRVVVDFDDRNRLRANEIAEIRSSVVVDPGPRMAVWRHRPPGSWVGRWRSLAGWQNLELDDGERVELLRFPLTWPRETDAERRRALKRLYRGGDWSLLRFEGETSSFGCFAIGPRSLVSGLPEDFDPSAEEEGAAATLSLDWLNRAGHVVRGGRALGLAEHHLQHSKVRTELLAQAEALTVSVSGGDFEPISYTLAPGERGPVGPLYVEYRRL